MDDTTLAFRFIVAGLATWRITHLLAHEDGPADIFFRLRGRLGSSFAGKLMDCFFCLSLWVAAPAAWFVTPRLLEWVVTWLALSGAACLLQRIAPESPPSVVIHELPEEGDTRDGMLRPETRQPEDGRSATHHQ